ncbi:hypothetical protein DPX16_7756 [Anabarilius grahami]|uniref:Uncharacterized protein n=1 Tax=Anabarilius grahami TaxID=495550 RepID=A0A3N0XJM5_ANAGA|nr:hypothetical protein DPX16_7756 [Anabarilius grahami]
MGANPLSSLYTEISIIAVELNCTPGGNKEAQETLCCWRLLRGPIILSKLEELMWECKADAEIGRVPKPAEHLSCEVLSVQLTVRHRPDVYMLCLKNSFITAL